MKILPLKMKILHSNNDGFRDQLLMDVLMSVKRAKTLLNLSQCSTRLRRVE